MPDKILNQSQAIAVRDAMCHLNNVSGRIQADVGQSRVTEDKSGNVFVFGYGKRTEQYANQSEFFAAYGIE